MQDEIPERFVALFDIIGFKALRDSLGTAGLMQKFERGILPLIQYSAAGAFKTEIREGHQVSVAEFNEFSTNYKIFSDTVIFWTRDNSFSSFLTIVKASSQLLAAGFGSKSPYRGAIGHGDFLEKAEIIVGQGIEDAFIWEESQAWAGASLTPACERYCLQTGYFERRNSVLLEALEAELDDRKKQRISKELQRLKRYELPLQSNPKDGPATYFRRESVVLDWTLNVFKGAAEKSMPESTNPHARNIKLNTIEFETWARMNAE